MFLVVFGRCSKKVVFFAQGKWGGWGWGQVGDKVQSCILFVGGLWVGRLAMI